MEEDYIKQNRPIAGPAVAQRDVDAVVIVIQRDLRGGRHEGEIRAPRADLEEAGADARVAPDRKADRTNAFALPDRRQHRPDEEIIRRHRGGAGRSTAADARA